GRFASDLAVELDGLEVLGAAAQLEATQTLAFGGVIEAAAVKYSLSVFRDRGVVLGNSRVELGDVAIDQVDQDLPALGGLIGCDQVGEATSDQLSIRVYRRQWHFGSQADPGIALGIGIDATGRDVDLGDAAIFDRINGLMP